jgi:hypothetical protein
MSAESPRAERDARPAAARAVEPAHVRAVRAGHGANCSSIGSVIDTLFIAAVAGGAVFAAVMAALAEEPVRTVDAPAPPRDPAAPRDAP